MELGEWMREIATAFVAVRGEKVLMHSEQCKEWMKHHSNCRDCISELGCKKIVTLEWLWLQFFNLAPFKSEVLLVEKAPERKPLMAKFTLHILNAKTLEEIDTVMEEAKEAINSI